MPHSTRRLRQAAFGLLLASATLPAGARADMAPLTPEQRHGLDQAIELWGMGLLGGDHGGGYSVSVDGDHYRLAAPLNHPIGRTGARIEGDTLAASAMPLDGGRWAIDNVQQPASIRFVPPPEPDGSPNEGVSIAQQAKARTSHMVIDPSLATTSSFDSTAEGVVVGIALPEASLDIKADRTTSHVAWQPAAGGRVDVGGATAADGVTFQMPGRKPGDDGIRMTARRLTSERQAGGFAPRRLADAVRAGLQLLETAPVGKSQAPGDGVPPAKPGARPPRLAVPKLDAAQRGLLHGMLDALHDAYGSLSQSVAIEGIDFAAQAHHLSLDKVTVSQSFAAPGGQADVHLRMSLDGIASPDIPPGILRELLPHHVVLAQHLAGLAVDDAFALLSKAIDSDASSIGDVTPAGIAALSRSPVTNGIDELSFDLGPAKLMASGSTRTAGPQDVTGSALVKATGLDALVKRISDDPLLGQGAPVLIFLKGIGQQDGDVVTWKMAFANGKFTVNGADLSQLIPHGK